MITPQIESLIHGWHSKSINEEDVFNRFIQEYIAFNAYFSSMTEGLGSDSDEIRNLVENKQLNTLFAKLKQNDEDFLTNLYLLGTNPLPTHRNRSLNRTGQIVRGGIWYQEVNGEDPSFSDVVWFIYQLRCNLFHGRKSPGDDIERRLVKTAWEVLHKLMNTIISAIISP